MSQELEINRFRIAVAGVYYYYEELEMFSKVYKKRESLLTLEILLLIIANSAWQLSVEK